VAAPTTDPGGIPSRAIDLRAAWTCRSAIVLAIAGVFGTWRNVGAVSLDGFEGPHNGWLVIVFALIAVAGVGPLSRGSWLGVATVFGCASVMVFTAVESVVDDNAAVGGDSGWGVWLTIVASVFLGGVAIAVAHRKFRARPG